MNRVSIITVTYNCADSIERTIESAFSQDYPDYELIVIDGASSDGTKEILDKYKKHFAYYISEKDKGIYDAMNKGIAKASGDWIIFLNSGDIFDGNDVLSRIFACEYGHTDVIYGDGRTIYAEGTKYEKPEVPFWESKKKWHGMGFSHQSVFVKSALAQKYPFDLSFRCCADYNMMVTIYNNGGRFTYVPVSVTLCEGRDGFSEKHRLLQMMEEAAICEYKNLLYLKYRFYRRRLNRFLKRKLNITR